MVIFHRFLQEMTRGGHGLLATQRRVGRGSRVRFPDVHLGTAGTVLADGRVVRGVPVDDLNPSCKATAPASRVSTELNIFQVVFNVVFFLVKRASARYDVQKIGREWSGIALSLQRAGSTVKFGDFRGPC